MSKRRKVMLIFGTRPEGTKMVPVIRALKAHPDWFDVVVVSTGQHREQLDQVFAAWGIKPDHDLAVMQHRQSLSGIMARVLTGLDEIFTLEKPDLAMVHGDTSTTAGGALTALYHKVELAHIEAGLRTWDKYSPWPEEVNRRIAGVTADIHLAPTPASRENLLRENVNPETIFVAGQTGVDATLELLAKPHTFENQLLREMEFSGRRVIVVTAHRRENLGEPMRNMFTAMRDLVDRHPDVHMIYPVTLSPDVREIAFPILSGHPRITLLDPISHPDMLHLSSKAYMVMADSGGLQEETPCMGVPQVLMRETTERPEAVAAGVVIKAGTSYQGVFDAAEQLLTDPALYERMHQARNPFGDGKSSERIAQYLAWRWGIISERPAEFQP